MDKELALRTFGYLIGHYKTDNETTINSQEIEAIEFIKSSQCKYDGWEITNQLYENEIKQLLDVLKDKEV